MQRVQLWQNMECICNLQVLTICCHISLHIFHKVKTRNMPEMIWIILIFLPLSRVTGFPRSQHWATQRNQEHHGSHHDNSFDMDNVGVGLWKPIHAQMNLSFVELSGKNMGRSGRVWTCTTQMGVEGYIAWILLYSDSTIHKHKHTWNIIIVLDQQVWFCDTSRQTRAISPTEWSRVLLLLHFICPVRKLHRSQLLAPVNLPQV